MPAAKYIAHNTLLLLCLKSLPLDRFRNFNARLLIHLENLLSNHVSHLLHLLALSGAFHLAIV